MHNGDQRVGWQRQAADATCLAFGAVTHAIANATAVWIKDLPITPEKILKAVRAKRVTDKAVPSAVAPS
jgi:hypothetical protein